MRDNNNKMKSIIFNPTLPKWILGKLTGRFTKSLQIHLFSNLQLKEVPIPKLISGDWVLCKTLIGGICGTDISSILLRQHPGSMLKNFISFPMMLGHENVAEIVEVGKNVDNVKVNQKVIIDPPHSCVVREIKPLCHSCENGEPSICLNFDRGKIPASLGLGYNNFTAGSWSEYFLAHKSQIYILPENIAEEDAILIDPLSCALHSILKSPPQNSENILIFGAGIIGVGILILLKAIKINANITITTKHSFQEEIARSYQADNIVRWSRNKDEIFEKLANILQTDFLKVKPGLRFLRSGFDRIYDCTGTIAGFNDAIRMLKPNGKYIIAGTPQLGLVDMTSVWFKQANIIGITGRGVDILPTNNQQKHDYEHIIDFIIEGKINISNLPRKFYRQNEYKRAILETINKKQFPYIKTAFDFR